MKVKITIILGMLVSVFACQTDTPATLEELVKPAVQAYLLDEIDTTNTMLDSFRIVRIDTTTDYLVAQMRLLELDERSQYYLLKAKLEQTKGAILAEEASIELFKNFGSGKTSEKAEESIKHSKQSQVYTDTANIYIDQINAISDSMDQGLIDSTNFLDYYVRYNAFITSTDADAADFSGGVRVSKDCQLVD